MNICAMQNSLVVYILYDIVLNYTKHHNSPMGPLVCNTISLVVSVWLPCVTKVLFWLFLLECQVQPKVFIPFVTAAVLVSVLAIVCRLGVEEVQ